MKTYLGVTAALFGLLTLVHVWRVIVEPGSRDVWMFGITVLSAALCFWAARLLWARSGDGAEQ